MLTVRKRQLEVLEHNEEGRLGEFNTHRMHQRQEKMRKAVSNLLEKFEEINRGKRTTKKTVINENVHLKAQDGSCGESWLLMYMAQI